MSDLTTRGLGIALAVIGLLATWHPLPSMASQTSSQPPALGAAQNTPVIRGHFTQKKYLAELDRPLVSSGQFVVAKNRGLIWSVEQPIDSQLVITQNRLLERSNGQQTTRLSADQQPALGAVASVLLAAFQGDVSQLRRFFDITQQQNGPSGWALTLVPKTAAVRDFARQLQIQGADTVRHIRIEQPGGDYSIIDMDPASGGPKQLTADEQDAFSR